MEGIERAGDLKSEVEQVAAVEAFEAEHLLERWAFHPFADDEVPIVGGGELVDRCQVRMTYRRQGGNRFLNAAALVRIGCHLGGYLPDRYKTVCLLVPGLDYRTSPRLT